MYPESFLQWLGYIGVIFGILILMAVIALWLDHKFGKKDDGRAALWLVFEMLSAVFVVTGLLVCIYGESKLLRAVAGLAMIVLVSTATASVIGRRSG